jgi:structural maintenance of chromosome 4
VPRLIDLIKVSDPKFLTAFYYSLRNTLVADDLEQATRIAYGSGSGQRNRVVTLRGEIIEVSGTMSGGGQPSRGRMGSKIVASVEEFSQEGITRMQESIRVDEALLAETRSRRQRLEATVHDLRSKVDKATANLVKWQNELASAAEFIQLYRTAEAQCIKRIAELTPDPAKQARLEEKLEQYREQFDEADRAAFKLREDNDELHKKIVDVSKKILEAPKAALKKLEAAIVDTKAQITNLGVEIKSSKRNLVNCEKKLAAFNEELETSQASLAKAQERLETIDSEGKELVEQHETVKKECDELGAEVRELSEKMRETESTVQTLEARRIDINHNLEKHNAALDEEKQRLRHYTQLLGALKLHNIDELENFGWATSSQESSMAGADERYQLKKIEPEDFEGVDEDALKREIHRIDENLKSQTPNLTVIEKYKELVSFFYFLFFMLASLRNLGSSFYSSDCAISAGKRFRVV